MRRAFSSFLALPAFLGALLVLSPGCSSAQPAAASAEAIHSKYSEKDFVELETLIKTTPREQMNLEFLKKIYRFQNAKDMLKLIMSRQDLRAQSEHLAELRKFYIHGFLAEYAKKHSTLIELTNQGKSNGLTSDFDVTGNLLIRNGQGELVLRVGVEDLIQYLNNRLAGDYLSADALDITLFNGDVFLPDARDERLSVAEHLDKTLKGVHDLRNQKGAYWAPGGNKEQTHDQALGKGRTVQIGYDIAADRRTINGRPFDFDFQRGEEVWQKRDGNGLYQTEGRVEELATRDAARVGRAVRYESVEELPAAERWLRALGNITQNVAELATPHDPVAWNKYFIERVIDQGVGRITDLPPIESVTGEQPPTYVQMHGADPKLFPDVRKTEWKDLYIQRGFGLPEKDRRIGEIRKLLDRAADIQLDKIDKSRNASWAERSKPGANNYYFREEWEALTRQPSEAILKLEEKYKAEGKQPPADELSKLREAEAQRLFFEAQRALIPEAAVRVAEESFRRDANRPADSPFADPAVRRKLNVDRGVELGGLLEIIERFPLDDGVRKSLRARLVAAVPKESGREVFGMMEIARRKLNLTGLDELGLEKYTKASDGISDRPLFLELAGEPMPPDPPPPPEEVKKKFNELVLMKLGPVQADRFRDAWEAGKASAIVKFGAKAYMKEMSEQVDGLMLTGAALSLINTYQQTCILQTASNNECAAALAAEAFNQVLFLLPVINSGLMIRNGLKEIAEGGTWNGSANVAVGVLSIPGVTSYLSEGVLSATSVLHVYVGFQLPLLAAAVTYGYAVQRMETDGVEQAFKALREPGKHARPFPTPNRSAVWNGDTPTIPLLADLVTVPADNLTDAQRNRLAVEQSGPAIEEELKQLGLKSGSPEWDAKRSELIVRYGMLLPYLQRMAKIHEIFGPKMAAAGENDDVMQTCLTLLNEDVDKRFAAEPGVVDSLRYWWDNDQKNQDRQKALGAGWSECVEHAVKADEAHLFPLLNSYVTKWFGKQEGDYRRVNETSLRPLLTAALIREYVVHRHLDQGQEMDRQMKRALKAVEQQSRAKLEFMGKLMAQETGLARQVNEKLGPRGSSSQPGAKPKLVLRVPPYAVRAGDPANIDVAARGQWGPQDDTSGINRWKADLDTEVTKVILSAPENLIVTPELRKEFTPQGGKPKRIVTIEEKLRGRLKDASGAELAAAETKVTYYDLVDWEGAINVEVRAATADTKNLADPSQTVAYPYAVVKLSGPARIEKEALPEGEVSRAKFEPLPEGSFSIHVDPRSTDQFHHAAEATVALAGISQGTGESGQPIIVLGEGAQSVTVVLPYTPLPAVARNTPPPAPPAGKTPDATNAVPVPRSPATLSPDIQLTADCDALLRRATTAFNSHDNKGAEGILNEATQHNCGNSPIAGQLDKLHSDIDRAQADLDANISQLQDLLNKQMGACDFQKAAATASQLSALAPNDTLAGILAQLERLSEIQANINSLLAAAANPADDTEAKDTLAQLQALQSQAPQCLRSQVDSAIGTLIRRLAAPGARGRIQAAIEACDYVRALAAAMELQAVSPNDEWLKANLGFLQAAAAEQSRILALLQKAKSAGSPADASDLAAQLGQALATAPACMASQIQAAIAELQHGAGTKPSWLGGPSQPGSQTSPDSNLNHAREILQKVTQDEVDSTNRRTEQQHTDEIQRIQNQHEQELIRIQAEKLQKEKEADNIHRKREQAQRHQETYNNITNVLGGIVNSLSGGKVPPVGSSGGGATGGAASEPDPFVGPWACHMKLISSRKMPLDGSVQGDFREIITKSGNSYWLADGRSGSSMPSTSVNGNTIHFGVSADGGSMTMDFQANGSRMSGTLRGTSNDDVFTASLQCNR